MCVDARDAKMPPSPPPPPPSPPPPPLAPGSKIRHARSILMTMLPTALLDPRAWPKGRAPTIVSHDLEAALCRFGRRTISIARATGQLLAKHLVPALVPEATAHWPQRNATPQLSGTVDCCVATDPRRAPASPKGPSIFVASCGETLASVTRAAPVPACVCVWSENGLCFW